jgi:two-component system sensor histidine kinase AtoS
MKNTKQRSLIDTILPGKNPMQPELNSLLQLLKEPAIILDGSRRTILAVNLPFLKLTSFVKNEVLERSVFSLFEGQPVSEIHDDMENAVSLKRSHRVAIPILVKYHALTEEGLKFIALFSMIDEKLTDSTDETLNFINMIGSVIEKPFSDDLEKWLGEIGVELSRIFGTSQISFYLTNQEEKKLQRVINSRQWSAFPDMLPISDLNRLQDTIIWMPGKRVLTEIHRFGRMNDFSYIGSALLKMESKTIGIIAVGGKNQQPGQYFESILKFIANYTSNEIQRFQSLKHLHDQSIDTKNRLGMLEAQFENSKDGICVLDDKFKLLFINPAAEWMLGYANWELINQSVENVFIGSKRLIPALEAACHGVATPNINEASMHRRDGRAFPAQFQVNPVMQDGQFAYILVFFRDISEHEEILARTQQLEHRAVLGDVTSIFAHEVRNPINNISTGLQLVASRLAPDDLNFPVIQRIQSDCVRLNDLMESVLAFSRPVEQKFEYVDMKSLIQRLLDRWHPRMTKVNVTPFHECQLNSAIVYGNLRSLEQVFINLISNAVDAMSKCGGILAIKIYRIQNPGNHPQLDITISDNGPGIPEEIRKKLFEPFVTNKTQGTGLGLAITKKIITAHHGSIYVDSFPGGTVFHVLLPSSNGETE